MTDSDCSAVAELIHVSTNDYYTSHGMGAIFGGEPEATTRLFCEVYEDLDPGCCLVVEHPDTGRLMGSCFYHPRETHVSLGIMNVHPSYFGQGLARRLLNEITSKADGAGKPTRLVSSALNLDSFSLYSRAGFVPHTTFQDILVNVPEEGLDVPSGDGVRDATLDDLAAIVDLEAQVAGIHRERDWAYFIENVRGIWHVSVAIGASGNVDGVLASVGHPGSRIMGPGVMRNEETAIDLSVAELDHHRGQTVLLLVPALARDLLGAVYAWGGRNCEIHFAQCRGEYAPFQGVVMPTFMPETG
ncbi:MAG: GNAT family N-acetyltransferase [Gemmatimonadetes bacterium]|nr:GNAT family N-acetyltransferase [Gemmatimonadota bacterium]|tara:strand:- start:1337 stop:2239 length:903 start_codon:yes stop_codon:yes gene_type:complete